ncbi:adenosylmethionine--8-amino-7-oxononanoate transaminase [Lentisphaerota bacterium WC36G]|nr:adenosylmethionine--8-amino-7-oxononanoate transaminase [Lentisphaerae bacterium WC36]
MDKKEILNLDAKYVWHPCAQMKDYETFEPLAVSHAKGSFIYTLDGNEVIDAISSWWCKSLGHGHDAVVAKAKEQLERFEHVIFANTASEIMSQVSERIGNIAPGLDKVFYADNGSTAVEIAMKLSLQYHAQVGNSERKKFLSLKNGYHGETILTLAAGDCELYTKPYSDIMPKIDKFEIEYCNAGVNDEKFQNYGDDAWDKVLKQLEPHAKSLSAIILEPLCQGAGGMLMYSADLLRRLRFWIKENGVHLIADEILTGVGRTGRMMACNYADIVPDFACFSKSLTSGFAPFSCTVCSTEVYNAFYDDYFTGKAFMHSNTYTGYPLGAAAAIAVLDILENGDKFNNNKNYLRDADLNSELLRSLMENVNAETNALINIRNMGYLCAADLVHPVTKEKFDPKQRTGYQIYQEAVKLGALLRPLGDTLYFMPPFNTDVQTLEKLMKITVQAVNNVVKK